MTETRRLAAVMFTDIVGYTAMMEKDENRAMEVLGRNRRIQKTTVKAFNGEYVKDIGDGILALFSSSVDAVRAALDIQRKVADDSGFQVRIGIHIGDVIMQEGDVFGDGVNAASRLQGACTPGGVLISGKVFDDIRNKKEFQTESLGVKSLKNISRPLKIYSVHAGASGEKNSKDYRNPLPERGKNSIVVLPFVNMSPDPDQEYFSDGLTEEIITDLSHIHDLLVISRSSAMTFKGTRKKISEIAGEVKVRYVLEGSVRKAGNNLRITAQLIDAQTDAHLWAEKYSGTLDDVFDIQEKVSTLIAEALKIKLSPAETSLLHERSIENVYAYDCYLQARRYTMVFTRDGLEKALQLLEKAAGFTGPNAAIYAGTAFAHFQYANMGIDQKHHIQEADRLIEKALKLDPESTDAHFALGCMNMVFHANVLKGLKHFKQAYQHRSGDTELMQWMSWLYALIGKTDEAMVLADRCIEIDPLNSGSRTLKALIYFMQGRFGEAEEPVLNCQQANPESNMWNLWAALLFAYTGRPEEAFELVETHVGEADQDGLGKLCLALKYALRGDAEGLSGLLDDDFKKTVHMDCQYSWHMASFYSILGEKKVALTWLEHAVKRGFINYPFLEHHDRLLDNIRKESRFTVLMKRVKKEWEHFEV